MTAEISCTNPECYESLDVEFEAEKAEPRTWMDPGYPATAWVTAVNHQACSCEQNEDIQEEFLLQWLTDRED